MEAAIAAIICASGSSFRMGGRKKEYCLLPVSSDASGTPPLTVLGAAVSAFAAVPAIETLVITVPADAELAEDAACNALPQELFSAERPRLLFVPGGSSRRASVHKGLSLLAPYYPGFVLIHDGARPWVSSSLIERVITAVRSYPAVIPLLPLTETPKETDRFCFAADGTMAYKDGEIVFIKRHLRRAATGTAQTPQAFAFPDILFAHEKAAEREINDKTEYTDDAEVWAEFCGPVMAIPGAPENRKITFPADLPC